MSKHYRHRVTLTFDVEPPGQESVAQHAAYDGSAILDELAKRGIHATFFLQGAWARRYPVLAKRVVEDGHAIGNHTDAHIRLSDCDEAVIRADIASAEADIKEATGVSPQPLFRCPQNAGGWDEDVLRLLKTLGYQHIHWNVDTYDWHEKAGLDDALARVRNGLSEFEPTVILMHSWTDLANEHLGELLDALATEDVEFVTVNQLLAERARIMPMVYREGDEPGQAGEPTHAFDGDEPPTQGTLGHSIAWGTWARIISIVANFAFSILLARSLGPLGKGEYAFIQQFVGILAVVLNFGLPTSNVYFVASKKISPQTAFANSVLLMLPTTLLSAVLTGIFFISPFHGQLNFTWPLFIASVLLFMTTALFGWLNAVLIGKHGLKPQGVATTVQSVVLILGVIAIGLLGHVSVVGMLYVAVISQFAGVATLYFFDPTAASLTAVHLREFTSMVRYSLGAYAIDVASFLHLRLDVLVLGWLSTSSEVGIYSVAVSFAEVMRYMPVIISSAFFAEIANYDNHEQELRTAILSRLNMAMSVGLAIGFFVLLPLVLPLLFGAPFKPSVLVAFVLLPGVLAMSLTEIPGTLLFAREQLYWKLAAVMVVVNIALNIVLVPRFSALGAATASSATYLLYACGILFMTKRETSLPLSEFLVCKQQDFALIGNKLRHR